jgi:hypothetical protein
MKVVEGVVAAFPAAVVVAVVAEVVAEVVAAAQHRERHRERQQVNPSTEHQAGLSLSVAELAEVLALIDAAASLQVQHMKALEDWSYWRTASTAEQKRQDSLTVQ